MKKKILPFIVIAVIMLLIGCSNRPDSKQIKSDLIGQVIKTGILSKWKFESLTEFQEFEIKNKREQGKVTEYDVAMYLNDSKKGKKYYAELLVVYKKEDGSWKLISISKKIFKQI